MTVAGKYDGIAPIKARVIEIEANGQRRVGSSVTFDSNESRGQRSIQSKGQSRCHGIPEPLGDRILGV